MSSPAAARRICHLAHIAPGGYPQPCTGATTLPEVGTPAHRRRQMRLEYEGIPMEQCENIATWVVNGVKLCQTHAAPVALEALARAQEI